MVSEHFSLEDGDKTKQQLLSEITALRHQIKALEQRIASTPSSNCSIVDDWHQWGQLQLVQQPQQQEQFDRNTWRILLLQQLTASLARALTTAEIFEILLTQGLAALSADRGWVAQRSKDPNIVEIVRSIGYQPEEIEPYCRVPLTSPLPATDVIRTGQSILIPSPEDYRQRYPSLAAQFIATGTQALVALPLIISDEVMGALGWSFAKPQTFNQTDYSFMLTLARQCAQSLERAYLYEAERIARETAEAANRVKDEFLAVLSHELRSPLNPILGWTKMLRSRRFDPQTTERAFDAIERNAKLQIQLIEDLLDVSHILQGKLRLNTSRVNLVPILEATLETVKLAATSKSIHIQFLLPFHSVNAGSATPTAADEPGSQDHGATQPVPVYVSGDPARLQQVFWNLISNAVKFTPAGGRIEVSLSVIQTSQSNKNAYAEIRVSDTGQGIDPVFLPYIFDYFRQADSTITRQFGGLGLGLTIVRHLVELHGGTVQAISEGEGKGTTFSVTLPLLQSILQKPPHPLSSSELPLPPALTQRLQQIRILVVDDDADMREFVAVVLQEAGAQVALASSAGEALAKLSRFSPHVLLSDLGLPNVNGYQLLKQIRTLVPELGGQVPAIALTAYTGEYDQQQIRAAGFQQHLSKPIEPEQLVLAVVRLLNQSTYHPNARHQPPSLEAKQKLT
jgi:signal transduction histidine kinase/CheY-like chemotaxis protein